MAAVEAAEEQISERNETMKRLVFLLAILMIAHNAQATWMPTLQFVDSTADSVTVRFTCGAQPTIVGITIQWQRVGDWPRTNTIHSRDFIGPRYFLFPGQSVDITISDLWDAEDYLIRGIARGGFGWTNNLVVPTEANE